MNETVNMFWIGQPLASVQACIDSFVSCGHPINLYRYLLPKLRIKTLRDGTNQEVPIVPFLNCTNLDAHTVIDLDALPLHRLTLADVSDWFRINLINQTGGWYVDTDCYCLKPLLFDAVNICVHTTRAPFAARITVFRLEADHPVLTEYLGTYHFDRFVLGTAFFAKVVGRHPDKVTIFPGKTLCADLQDIEESTYIVHFSQSANEERNLRLIENLKSKI